MNKRKVRFEHVRTDYCTTTDTREKTTWCRVGDVRCVIDRGLRLEKLWNKKPRLLAYGF